MKTFFFFLCRNAKHLTKINVGTLILTVVNKLTLEH